MKRDPQLCALIRKALDHGHTRRELGVMCGVSATTIRRWELGRVPRPTHNDRIRAGCSTAIRTGIPGAGIPDRRWKRQPVPPPPAHPWRKSYK